MNVDDNNNMHSNTRKSSSMNSSHHSASKSIKNNNKKVDSSSSSSSNNNYSGESTSIHDNDNSDRKLHLSFDKLLLLFSVLFYIYVCPYTKVEESFNMQATHDLLQWRFPFNLYDFDHLEFPGVVPRTFFGGILLAIFSLPLHLVVLSLSFPLLYSQYTIRGVLGFISWRAFVLFSDAVGVRFGERAGKFTAVLTAVQFHLPYYMSRTLPNTFALIGSLIAYTLWLRGKGGGLKALVSVTISMVIFRCDLLLLLAPLTLQMLCAREVPLFLTAGVGIMSALVALMLTVTVDSFFWQRYVWPEGVVLFFNTVQNKSIEWGVMSWHWYLSNAIPKALHISIPLAILGISGLRHPFYDLNLISGPEEVKPCNHLSSFMLLRNVLCCMKGPLDWELIYYCLPVPSYLALYSLLPHKVIISSSLLHFCDNFMHF
jgi:alpha-1,6-mannosyltransferase